MNKHSLDFLKLKSELEKMYFEIEDVKSRRHGKQKITYIYLKDSFVNCICFVDGKGYYERGKEHHCNLYCGENGDTKYGSIFKSYKKLVDDLVYINRKELLK